MDNMYIKGLHKTIHSQLLEFFGQFYSRIDLNLYIDK